MAIPIEDMYMYVVVLGLTLNQCMHVRRSLHEIRSLSLCMTLKIKVSQVNLLIPHTQWMDFSMSVLLSLVVEYVLCNLQSSCSFVQSVLVIGFHYTLCKVEVLSEFGYVLE